MAEESAEHFRDSWHNLVRVEGKDALLDSQELWDWVEEQPGFYYVKILNWSKTREIWMFTDPNVAFEFRIRWT